MKTALLFVTLASAAWAGCGEGPSRYCVLVPPAAPAPVVDPQAGPLLDVQQAPWFRFLAWNGEGDFAVWLALWHLMPWWVQ